MRRLFVIALLLTILVLPLAVADAQTSGTVIRTTGDAGVNSGSPNENYGGDDYLKLDLSPNQRWAYLRFPVACPAAMCDLWVYAENAGVDAEIELYQTTNFGVDTLTWNNRPAVGDWVGFANLVAGWNAIPVDPIDGRIFVLHLFDDQSSEIRIRSENYSSTYEPRMTSGDAPTPTATSTLVPPTPTATATDTPTEPPPVATPVAHPTETSTASPSATPTPTASRIPSASPTAPPPPVTPTAPGSGSACTSTVSPGGNLQTALNGVQAGQVLCLNPGPYQLTQSLVSARDDVTIRGLIGPNGERAIVRGWHDDDGRVVQINHDRLILRDFDITRGDKLLWLDTASGNLITGMKLYQAGGECLRIKHLSSNNTVSHNEISECGNASALGDNGGSGKNGEGVYIGTAPEQRSANACNCPDASNNNIIEHNTIETNANEAVDIKEDAEQNIVRFNTGRNQFDTESAMFDSRGDRNTFEGNVAINTAGAGFRLGGDTVGTRVYGKNNILRDNRVEGATHSGFKLMQSPQDIDCSNTATGLPAGRPVFYFGSTKFDIEGPCDGT